MTPELLWKLGRVSGGSVSPDGKWVLYGISYYDMVVNKGNRDLYVIPANGGDAKKITSFKGSEFNEFWKPDGKSIGFLSAEGGSVQVWEVNPDGTNAHAVTSIENGINSFLYSYTGNDIVYTQDVKTEKNLAEKIS